MTPLSMKDSLKLYLQQGRDALLFKLDGLSEYDARRPLVASGTNVLGLLKHVAGVEAGYLGEVFDRPFTEPLPWMADDADVNADMWATPDESRESLITLYRRVWAHSDATIDALPLDALGRVAWWIPENREVTLHHILVHLIAETHRHAGHADIVRELIDGSVGLRRVNDNLPEVEPPFWVEYRARLEHAARTALGS